MIYKRRKGVAIVDTNKGILVVAGRSRNFALPGGGAKKWETREKAAIRELYEETGLRTKRIKYLFQYEGRLWRNHEGKTIRNRTKVFLIESQGKPKPRSEIKHINFWRPKTKIKVDNWAKEVIKIYLREYKFR